MRLLNSFLLLAVFALVSLPSPVWANVPFAVVELFTSQGCSSCPEADEVFNQLAKQSKENNSRTYFLGFHVDYWDYLGWKDPFSNPEFTQRQYKYSKALASTSTYTPQMIINGRQAFIGSERGKARRFIKIYQEVPATNTLTLNVAKRDHKQVEVSYECDRLETGSVIHFALTESGFETRVNAGENKGRVLKNDHVVREFKTVPLQRQGTVTLNFPISEVHGSFEVVVYVQNPDDMRIYAAERVVLD